MEAARKELDAKGAIAAAFAHFNEFKDIFGPTRLNSILLEGVEYLESDNQWLITVGFDVGREKTMQSRFGFGDQTKEPIREFRRFFLSATDGSLVRMDRD